MASIGSNGVTAAAPRLLDLAEGLSTPNPIPDCIPDRLPKCAVVKRVTPTVVLNNPVHDALCMFSAHTYQLASASLKSNHHQKMTA